jgi:hypothetical protein
MMGLFGSIAIGLLVIYQNKNFQTRNDEIQVQMKIINDKLLDIENKKVKPQIGLKVNNITHMAKLHYIDINILIILMF